jgi:hypothetical protein
MHPLPSLSAIELQGCVRYIALNDGEVSDGSTAALVEAWVFCSSILPQMEAADAKAMRDMLGPKNAKTIVMNDAMVSARRLWFTYIHDRQHPFLPVLYP